MIRRKTLMSSSDLIQILKRHSSEYQPVIPFDFNKEGTHIDLSINNRPLQELVPNNVASWEKFIWNDMKEKGAKVAAGGYGEERTFYLNSELFTSGEEPRIIHMGIDIWAVEDTSIAAPLDGVIHSFQDNQSYLDYGPAIILQHELEGVVFHTLYGHLNRKSLEGKRLGQSVQAGEVFAALGSEQVNGGWPPHLHFQIIKDMQGMKGDFQGLCSKSNKEEFSKNCPDPNLLLNYRF